MGSEWMRSLRRAFGRPDPPPAPAADRYATIHKGAYVAVRLYLEGDEPPAHDFAQTARDATARILAAGIAAAAAPLQATVKRIEVDDDPPDSDEAEEG
ncbi:MAG TPA: hypothetical protein VFI42_13205 [Thermomicrobiaceae bacterium]|nr:hypothetical protein [Thermomicrobiaceae bacterium]